MINPEGPGPHRSVEPRKMTIDEIRNLAAERGGNPTRPMPPQVPVLNPVLVDPTTRQPVKSALSPATQEGLEALAREQKKQAEQKAEEDKRQKENERLLEEETRQLAGMGEFDYESFRRLLVDNPFLTPGIRERIEGAVEPIAIKDLIIGRGKQRVPIIPGVLEVDFQTPKIGEDLLIKRLLRGDSDQLSMYFDDKRAMMMLAIGLVAINGNALPPLEDEKAGGKTTETTLMRRYEAIMELPVQTMAWIAINYNWFDARVKRTLTPTALGNG